MKTNKKSQWADLKTIVIIVILIIVMVIIIRNYIFTPAGETGKCEGLGGTCMEKCTQGYFPVPGMACREGFRCCQPEQRDNENA